MKTLAFFYDNMDLLFILLIAVVLIMITQCKENHENMGVPLLGSGVVELPCTVSHIEEE